MNTNSISRIVIDEHLAKGIPALSRAVGLTPLNDDSNRNINMDTPFMKPNGDWHTEGKNLDNRWWHADIKDTVFFYVYPLFDQLVTIGVLK